MIKNQFITNSTQKDIGESFGFLCEDGVRISPENDRVYFYPDWATDGFPCFGLLKFNNESREWQAYHGERSGPIFATRQEVQKYINARKAEKPKNT